MTLRRGLEVLGVTENMATSYNTTQSNLLDFYFHAPAVRISGGSFKKVVDLFAAAFSENPTFAIAAAFYMRDIRQGQGEREAFRMILLWLADNHPAIFIKIMHLIPEYGRWDDLLIFGAHASVGQDIRTMVSEQFADDIASDRPSLLGKWLPSENASSRDTRKLARLWMRHLGYAFIPHRYRRILSRLRTRIGIVERLMSSNRWSEINYSSVPSNAMLIYRNAYNMHDHDRFQQWLADVKAGRQQIKAGTLYPHQLISKLGYNNDVVEAQWKALPNYFENLDSSNVLVVCDHSGSMHGDPMLVASSLALYAAERISGQFADSVITFSAQPTFIQIPRALSLLERYSVLMHSGNIGTNTNFQAVFDLILDTAIRHDVPQHDMPALVAIISDMQFDQADGVTLPPYLNSRLFTPRNPTNFEAIQHKYTAAGYTMPRMLFWNVRSTWTGTDAPVTMREPGVYLVAGLSPVIFKHALSLDTSTPEVVTPYDAMIEVLTRDRYQPVLAAVV